MKKNVASANNSRLIEAVGSIHHCLTGPGNT